MKYSTLLVFYISYTIKNCIHGPPKNKFLALPLCVGNRCYKKMKMAHQQRELHTSLNHLGVSGD